MILLFKTNRIKSADEYVNLGVENKLHKVDKKLIVFIGNYAHALEEGHYIRR